MIDPELHHTIFYFIFTVYYGTGHTLEIKTKARDIIKSTHDIKNEKRLKWIKLLRLLFRSATFLVSGIKKAA